MSKFKLDVSMISKSLVTSDELEKIVIESILDTNSGYSYYYDPMQMCNILKCNNKPKNRPIYNINWIEVS